jgi:hypothetical protein
MVSVTRWHLFNYRWHSWSLASLWEVVNGSIPEQIQIHAWEDDQSGLRAMQRGCQVQVCEEPGGSTFSERYPNRFQVLISGSFIPAKKSPNRYTFEKRS